MRKIGIGIIGLGTVGSGVVEAIRRNGAAVRDRTGLDLVIQRVADVDPARFAALELPQLVTTTNAAELIRDPNVDVVVELVGGTGIAKEFILDALQHKKHVVTANKALLAVCCGELSRAAVENGVELKFEASVAGGIPILKTLREGLVANELELIMGILNGTCNFILTQMADHNMSFREALKEAQKKGFAEANPTLDIEGHDSAHKLAIAASLGFCCPVKLEDIHVEGITKIRSEDVHYADEMGFALKLLAIAKKKDGKLEARVHPTLIPKTHLLASVKNEYNAVYVTGNVVGTTMYYGKGAGKFPTASAVLSDMVDIGKSIDHGSAGREKPFVWCRNLPVQDMADTECRYYFRLTTADRPGVLGEICTALGNHAISIASVIQKPAWPDAEEHPGSRKRVVPVVMMTHQTTEKAVRGALKAIESLECVRGDVVVIRVE